jgi:hypothetical protein
MADEMRCGHCNTTMRKWQPLWELKHSQAESWGGDVAKVGRLITFDAGVFCSKPCLVGYLVERYPDPVPAAETRVPRPPSTVR